MYSSTCRSLTGLFGVSSFLKYAHSYFSTYEEHPPALVMQQFPMCLRWVMAVLSQSTAVHHRLCWPPFNPTEAGVGYGAGRNMPAMGFRRVAGIKQRPELVRAESSIMFRFPNV